MFPIITADSVSVTLENLKIYNFNSQLIQLINGDLTVNNFIVDNIR